MRLNAIDWAMIEMDFEPVVTFGLRDSVTLEPLSTYLFGKPGAPAGAPVQYRGRLQVRLGREALEISGIPASRILEVPVIFEEDSKEPEDEPDDETAGIQEAA